MVCVLGGSAPPASVLSKAGTTFPRIPFTFDSGFEFLISTWILWLVQDLEGRSKGSCCPWDTSFWGSSVRISKGLGAHSLPVSSLNSEGRLLWLHSWAGISIHGPGFRLKSPVAFSLVFHCHLLDFFLLKYLPHAHVSLHFCMKPQFLYLLPQFWYSINCLKTSQIAIRIKAILQNKFDAKIKLWGSTLVYFLIFILLKF